MESIRRFVENNTSEYLVIDGQIPFVTNGTLSEEAILFNLDLQKRLEIYKTLKMHHEIEITDNHKSTSLSHGQKIIIIVYYTLYAPALKIKFSNIFRSLSKPNQEVVNKLIKTFREKGKQIEIVNDI